MFLVLVVHIALALALLLPALVLPLVIRRGGLDGRLGSFLAAAQGRWAPVIGLGLVLSGIALVASLSLNLGRQTWLLVALAIYVVNLAIALFIQRPGLRRLVGLGAGPDGAAATTRDDAAWRSAARRLRSVSYLMAALIGAIGFLMMAKPQLW